MRAPGDAPGMMALEIAIDEIAEKAGLDPVAFRIINDTQVDPENPGRPFSQRNLIGCLKTGAERFGWSARSAQPGKVREGRWLVGKIGRASGRARVCQYGEIEVVGVSLKNQRNKNTNKDNN